jgi:mannan endo-1,4-beta-mannosidase
MNHMDRQLRDLLDAAAGEPPHQVTVEAVRRRVTRHRATQYLAAAAAAAVIAVIIPTGIGALGRNPGPSAAGERPAAVPAARAYLGVLENGPGYGPPGYGQTETFARAAGREPNLVGYYSLWEQPFALLFANSMYRHGLVPLVRILPVDQAGVSVSAIASGSYDGYLSAYAEAVRAYGHPVVIAFGPEMNADWWTYGYTHTPAPVFVAAWRHIVTLFRALGADNVTWLWTIQADGIGAGPVLSWWPGANYVTWIGIDGFYLKPSSTFNSVFVPTIDQVRTFTTRPILLSDTAVAPSANQYAEIINLFHGIGQYRLLGLVWFDNDLQPGASASLRRAWRIEDRPLAERAFRMSTPGLRLVRP